MEPSVGIELKRGDQEPEATILKSFKSLSAQVPLGANSIRSSHKVLIRPTSESVKSKREEINFCAPFAGSILKRRKFSLWKPKPRKATVSALLKIIDASLKSSPSASSSPTK